MATKPNGLRRSVWYFTMTSFARKLLFLSLTLTLLATATGMAVNGLVRQDRRVSEILGHRVSSVIRTSSLGLGEFPPAFFVKTIFQDSRGRFWFGDMSRPSVVCYDEGEKRWSLYADPGDRLYRDDFSCIHCRKDAVLPSGVAMIGESRDGRIWFAPSSVGYIKTPTGFVSDELGAEPTYFDGTRWGKVKGPTGSIRVRA
ncbi:MAG TPA: hypothetical protein VI756_18380 [Blastocatellia bacterium]